MWFCNVKVICCLLCEFPASRTVCNDFGLSNVSIFRRYDRHISSVFAISLVFLISGCT